MRGLYEDCCIGVMDGTVVRRHDMGMKHGENLPLWPYSMLDLQNISKNKQEMNLDSIQLFGFIGRTCGENGHGDA